jgi:hypothetical protein
MAMTRQFAARNSRFPRTGLSAAAMILAAAFRQDVSGPSR